MLRLAEFGLFLVPFGLFLAWLLLERVSAKIAIFAGVMFVLMAGATILYGLERRVDRDEVYIPARMQDGQIVQGHGVR